MIAKGIVAVYLAAGKSSRMGANKLALPLGKTTIGSAALQSAFQSKLIHIMVVVKPEDNLKWMDPSFFQQPCQQKWTHVVCSSADKGQAYSLKCGVRAAMKLDPYGIMVMLADQPFLQVKTINELILQSDQAFIKKDHPAYIAAGSHGIAKPPIIFHPKLIPALEQLNGDEGARKLLRGPASNEGLLIEIVDEMNFLDIDTMEEYAKAVKGWK